MPLWQVLGLALLLAHSEANEGWNLHVNPTFSLQVVYVAGVRMLEELKPKSHLVCLCMQICPACSWTLCSALCLHLNAHKTCTKMEGFGRWGI